MRRVLNSFLQFMEEPNATDSLIIGTTNHQQLLDRALLRRFDIVLEFQAPTDDQIEALIRANLRPLKFSRLSWVKIIEAARTLSQSEIVRAAEDAVKSAILDERNRVNTADVLERLHERTEMREAFAKAEQ
jgi:AAA+ superfamily predicted ATPase